MKIAYLILCHTDPAHNKRLVEKLTTGTENVAFIHVDAKTDAKPFEDLLHTNQRAVFIHDRTALNWGGYSAVEATVKLMKCAVNNGRFDRFILLQGLDYPIKTNKEIDDFFDANRKTEFFHAQNLSISTDKTKIHKIELNWDLDHDHRFPEKIINTMNKVFLKIRFIPKMKEKYTFDQFGNKMDIFQGSALFGFTQDVVEYILDFHDNNPEYNKYFKKVFAPDESYFHTILYNSPYVENTQDGKAVTRGHMLDYANLTYFEYPVQARLFKYKSEWPILRDSGFLYFRKASSESKELLDYIDSIHESKEDNK